MPVMEMLAEREICDSHHRTEDEARRKLVTLREGIRDMMQRKGIILSQGVSNEYLFSCVAQLSGREDIKFLDCLNSDWKDEYNHFSSGLETLLAQIKDGPDRDEINHLLADQ